MRYLVLILRFTLYALRYALSDLASAVNDFDHLLFASFCPLANALRSALCCSTVCVNQRESAVNFSCLSC